MNSGDPIHIISLGAGVQSSVMALMAGRGEIGPMPVAAIFADTKAEPPSVYRWLDWLEKQLPFPVQRVTAGSLTRMALTIKSNRKTGEPYYSNMIPAFIQNPDGSRGIVERHCTYNAKIIPLTRAARKMGHVKRGEKSVRVIQWIGISLDEVVRMKPSREPWCEHRWPLVDERMSRHDCLRWMESRGYPTPPRSACVYCPFHSDAEWRRLKTSEPKSFRQAVLFERRLQKLHQTMPIKVGHPALKGRIKGVPFLHDSLIPLDQIDLSSDVDRGQMHFGNECEGMCGV